MSWDRTALEKVREKARARTKRSNNRSEMSKKLTVWLTATGDLHISFLLLGWLECNRDPATREEQGDTLEICRCHGNRFLSRKWHCFRLVIVIDKSQAHKLWQLFHQIVFSHRQLPILLQQQKSFRKTTRKCQLAKILHAQPT